ncbi:MAG: hypothetical protein ACLTCP_06520 [Ruminococcus bicirculans (ex Wegman et al. 2014)]
MVREAYAEEKDGCSDSLFGLGEPNVNFAQYFIGNSYLKPLNVKGIGVFNVTFEPKCRNNWHIHHKGGQILLCTDGEGWYQEWGQPAKSYTLVMLFTLLGDKALARCNKGRVVHARCS